MVPVCRETLGAEPFSYPDLTFLLLQVAAVRPVAMFDAGELHPAAGGGGGRRLTAAERVAKWRGRRGLLASDPREDELPAGCVPPGEAAGQPCQLTPLGQRLVGLLQWGPAEEEVGGDEAVAGLQRQPRRPRL